MTEEAKNRIKEGLRKAREAKANPPQTKVPKAEAPVDATASAKPAPKRNSTKKAEPTPTQEIAVAATA